MNVCGLWIGTGCHSCLAQVAVFTIIPFLDSQVAQGLLVGTPQMLWRTWLIKSGRNGGAAAAGTESSRKAEA